jgi:signal transduction histidine kinase
MSLTFERKLPVVLTFVFFMLTTVGIFSYQSTISLREEQKRQSRARTVLELLDDVLTRSVDTDNAVTSFVVTGDSTYLDPLSGSDKRIAEDLAKLDALTAEDKEQDIEFDKLKALAARKSESNKKLIESRRGQGFDVTVNQLPAGAFQQVRADFRTSIETIKSREMKLLGEHEETLDNNMDRTILILIVSSLAGVAALVLANFIVMIENNRRRLAERALIRANEELEAKVEERTRELHTANVTLLASASEREELLAKEQEARREAEIANRLRDEFMATVSHELRTPLNSILGWARLLKSGQLEARQTAKAVQTIIKNSESQNRLIEDLLDVARMISGKLQLEFEEVPVADIVEDSVESAKPEAAKRNIAVRLQIHDALRHETVTGDKVRLQQIIGNLLTNAIKFSSADSAVDVNLKPDGQFVEISVRDHGVGISKEFLPLVFERFRQDRSTIKQSGGLGLGLAVVRNLTERHGGTVSAHSDGEGKGSTFSVRLPLANGHDISVLEQIS